MFSFPSTLSYILIFCRFVIGLVFALSFAGKARNISAFEQTVTRFKLLPPRLSRVAAFLLLGAELIVVFTMLLGGSLLLWGFLLALLMLFAFCVALASVMLRKIETSCYCFGTSDELVSSYDIFRNLGFILCGLGGYLVIVSGNSNQIAPGVMGWALVAIVAGVFVMVWLQIGEILKFFKGV